MELQERDQHIIQFIEKFKVSTIQLTGALFFPGKTHEACRSRLQTLTQNKYLKCSCKGFGRAYVFYPRGCRCFNAIEEQRRLAVTRFYVELVKATNKGILKYETYTKADYAPFDLIVYFIYENRRYLAFVNSSLYKKYPKDKIMNWHQDHRLFKKYIQNYYGQIEGYLFINLVDRSAGDKTLKTDKRLTITELDIQSHRFLDPMLIKLKKEDPSPVLRKVFTTSDLTQNPKRV